MNLDRAQGCSTYRRLYTDIHHTLEACSVNHSRDLVYSVRRQQFHIIAGLDVGCRITDATTYSCTMHHRTADCIRMSEQF